MIDLSHGNDLNHKLLVDITGLSYQELEKALLTNKNPKSGSNAKELVHGLAELFNVRVKDAANMLGISESRLSRNNKVDKTMLDNAEAIISIYSKVAKALGSDAASWFKSSNPALNNRRPLDQLDTQYGRAKIENTIDALLHGAYL